jgi:superfamily II DNA/RNA helicase
MEILNGKILKQLFEQKMVYMTSAQEHCFENIFKNPQTLNLAETGSGKTLMYLLPLINDLYRAKEHSRSIQQELKFWENPKGALILTSTKELCTQIYRDLKTLDADDQIKATRLGSLSMVAPVVRRFEEIKKPELQEELSNSSIANYVDFKKMDVVISTPSQLETLIEAKRIRRLNPKYIIIDEADLLMTDLKNIKILSSILDKLNLLNPDLIHLRKVILTAATFPKQIKRNSMEEYLKKYFPNLKVSKSENYLYISKDLDHTVVDVEGLDFQERCRVLAEVINSLDQKNYIVFCNDNKSVKKITEYLTSNDIPCQAHHIEQKEGESVRAINLFSTGEYRVLVCCDSINRGIHFNFPLHLIQFDLAENMYSLIHRVGRTGRMGRQPTMTSFIDSSNRVFLGLFQGAVGRNN